MTEKEILAQLTNPMRAKTRCFLDKAKAAGFSLRITSGYRSIAEQNELYKIGRRGIPGEKIVTNAKGGQSNHNFRIAIDVVDRSKGYNIDWAKLGKLGKSCGLAWGGDWTKFPDKPHFEDKGGAIDSPPSEEDTGEEMFVQKQIKYLAEIADEPMTQSNIDAYAKKPGYIFAVDILRTLRARLTTQIKKKDAIILKQQELLSKLPTAPTKEEVLVVAKDMQVNLEKAQAEQLSFIDKLKLLFGG